MIQSHRENVDLSYIDQILLVRRKHVREIKVN